jgi:hypothetical protein
VVTLGILALELARVQPMLLVTVPATHIQEGYHLVLALVRTGEMQMRGLRMLLTTGT